ncbi:reverse transcriptase domain-containing protein [Tanacetum coccineum]
MEHVHRDHNKKMDALSKLASMTFSRLAKEVLVEVLHEKSIVQKEVAGIIKEEGHVQAKTIIQEIHQGSYRMHAGSRSVVSKIMKQGYYWPSMHNDAKALIQRCEACRIYSSIPRKPKQEMKSITSASPISQWGIDIVGPLPMALGGARFLVVATDYFTKWVEAKLLVSTMRKNIPSLLPKTWAWSKDWERPTKDGWMSLLWAHRTTPKSSNGETPFSLVYGLEAFFHIEICVETKRIKEFKVRQNEKRRREDLDILEERREIASIREAYYKHKLEGYYNKRVRPSTFKPDENHPPPPPPSTQQTPTQQTPHTVLTIKLPILKKGEYDIWAMKMEHYLAHTDYPIWETLKWGDTPSIRNNNLESLKKVDLIDLRVKNTRKKYEFTLSSLEVLLILATFDGLDVGLLEDVIGEDDCDEEMSLKNEKDEMRLNHLKQDLRMLVIKRFREKKKVVRERKSSKNSCKEICFSAGNEAVFIGRKTQWSLQAVLAVPDIYGERQTSKGAAQ